MKSASRCVLVFASILYCAAAFAQATSTSSGQAYPTRPIRIVVPYTPGGITDVSTRIVAAELAKKHAEDRLKAIKDEAGYEETHTAYIRAVTRLAVAGRQRGG